MKVGDGLKSRADVWANQGRHWEMRVIDTTLSTRFIDIVNGNPGDVKVAEEFVNLRFNLRILHTAVPKVNVRHQNMQCLTGGYKRIQVGETMVA